MFFYKCLKKEFFYNDKKEKSEKMNIELINEPNKNYLALEQILINRGLSESQIYDYLNLSSDVVSSPVMFRAIINFVLFAVNGTPGLSSPAFIVS